MSKWPRVVFGDIASFRKEFVQIEDTETYKRCRVQLHAQGVILRDSILGVDIKTKRQQVCRAGEFLVAEIDAKHGGYGLVPDELDGAIVSSHYFLFEIRDTLLNPGFLNYFSKTPGFMRQVEAQGTTNYAAVRPSDILCYTIPLPSLAEQHQIIARLDAVTEKARQVAARLDAIEADAERLLAVRFHETIKEAQWKPMGEVAPVVRREVEIDLQEGYPELGIRSFGKGTFHKPQLSGADVGSKRLFRIEPGDLLFSNVFAWEGAIAVASDFDRGRFGSHRFISCVSDPSEISAEFLCYYFLTPGGLERIREASPGGAGRNRTLGIEKLMAIPVPVPPLTKQHTFNTVQATVAAMKAKHATIRKDLDAVLPSMLEQIF